MLQSSPSMRSQGVRHDLVTEQQTTAKAMARSHGKNVQKREPLCTAGGDVNWRSLCVKQRGGFSKNLKVELPHDPATLLLSIYQIYNL